MSVQATQAVGQTAVRNIRVPVSSLVALGCALALLAAFFLLPWFQITTAEEVTTFAGTDVLAWNQDIQRIFVTYQDRVAGEVQFTQQEVSGQTMIIPIAGVVALGLALWGLLVPRQRRVASILLALAGAFSLLYYFAFFLSDRNYFLVYFAQTRSQTANITLTNLGASGFWLGLFAGIGLLLQYWIGRARRETGPSAIALPAAIQQPVSQATQTLAGYRARLTANPRYLHTLAFIFRFQSFFGLFVIILLAILFSPIRNDQRIFLSERNISNVTRDVSETGVLAVGQLLAILVVGIDLSVGSVVALTATGAAHLLMRDHVPAIPTILFILALGAFIGWFNGWTSERFRIPAFVTTLAMLSIARGLAHVWSSDIAVPLSYEAGGADPLFSLISKRINGIIPVPAIIMFTVAIIMGLILAYTTFGRHIYAIGGNATAARLSGINVIRSRIVAFVLCGFFASLAGIMHAAQLNQGSPNEAVGYELNAIAAVVIGGASLSGGKGTVAGAIAGAFILGILDNMLSLNNVNSNVQLITKGLLVIGAVALQQFRPRDVE